MQHAIELDQFCIEGAPALKLPVNKVVLAGIGSAITIELLVTVPAPELEIRMVYCATAPGMYLELVIPLKGSFKGMTVFRWVGKAVLTVISDHLRCKNWPD